MIRPDVRNDDILFDLSNFIAHPDKRNQGKSFVHINSFITKFLDLCEKGGTLFVGEPIFKSDIVIERLVNILKELMLVFDSGCFVNSQEKIINSLQEQMNETHFDLKLMDPRVDNCYLYKDNNKICFRAHLSTEGPVLKVSSVSFLLFN